MKTFKTMLRGTRGWAEEFAEALRGYDLELLQPGGVYEEARVFLTPLAPGIVMMGRPGSGSGQR